MAENLSNEYGSTSFREAVCIDSNRIYDSCSDKDCLSDLHVLFPENVQSSVIDFATSVKVKNVSVLNVLIDVESVPFNKGFYSVDMTYFFEIVVEASLLLSPPVTVSGLAIAEKKAILFGSEGNVRTFSTNFPDTIFENNNMPTAHVQVVDPICLSSELVASCEPIAPVKIPDNIASHFNATSFGRGIGAPADSNVSQKELFVTLGLFSIVSLTRRVQMLIPCYDFCIPDKDCSTSTDTPCELFSKIQFPTDQFFPPKLDPDSDCSSCRG